MQVTDGIFVYTISDIIGLGALVILAVISVVVVVYKAIKQAFCKHKFRYVDAMVGGHYHLCDKCQKRYEWGLPDKYKEEK